MQKIPESAYKRGGLAVFGASFLLRIILDVVFHLRFGWHAGGHLEVWLYTGVAEGTMLTGTGLKDPTVWLLRAVGALLPGYEFYGVILTAAFLSSLTAYLLYLLASELYGQKTGFAAGLIYGGMVEPLGLSMSGFTHDLFQLPLMVAVILLTVKACKYGGWTRAACIAAAVVIVYDARMVNSNIWVGVAVAAAYVGSMLVAGWKRGYAAYMGLVLAAILLGRMVLAGQIEAVLAGLPQGRLGSSDVVPITVLVFWLRDNILLFLLPFGLFAAYRRRDAVAVSLFFCGLALATVMNRGTRIGDLGLAMLAAYAITDWEAKTGFPSFFSKKDRMRTVAVVSLVVFAYMAAATDTRPAHLAAFAAGGVSLMICIWRLHGNSLILGASSVAFLVGASALLIYIYSVDGLNITTETEYGLLRQVDPGGGGRILAPWDHGYFAQDACGLKSVSNPGGINMTVHDLLWLPEEEAAAKLRAAGVRYVLFSGENYYLGQDETGRRGLITRGGFVWLPKKLLPEARVGEYAIHRLRYRNATDFRLVADGVDGPTGLEFFLYEVAPA
ncbi:MAG: glycosyltransferase family 39 protein [Candidatus Altiarchaeota archaeon]